MTAMEEIWKDVPGYDAYEVSDQGMIRNKKHGNLLRAFDRANDGYLSVHLVHKKNSYRNHTVHSIVMNAFMGERPKRHVINHLNSNRADNRLVNLEYCTQSHNRKHTFLTGRQSLLGEKNNQAKITGDDVLKILALRRQGYTYSELALQFKLTVPGISNIFNGHTWSHITGIKSKWKQKTTASQGNRKSSSPTSWGKLMGHS